MATYAIGDIQGCYDQLRALLDKIAFDPAQDILWFAGDLVNRGPKSLEVLRFVKSLGRRAITVLGNHDLHLMAIAYQQIRLNDDDCLAPILRAPDRDELIEWLRQQPLLHEDPTLGYILLHAGLPPQWTLAQAKSYAREVEDTLKSDRVSEFFQHMYGNEPAHWSTELRGWPRLRFITNCFTRLRYCDQHGMLDLTSKGPPGNQPAPFQPWFSWPERATRDQRLIFGHWSTLPEISIPNIFPIDTGCLWGGYLTALQLENDAQRISHPCPQSLPPKRG